MGRTWATPVFKVAFPAQNVTTSVRRAMAQMNRNSPALKKALAACDAIGLKYLCPYGEGNCFAHIAMPSKKVVIYMRASTDSGLFTRVKEEWKKLGWDAMLATTRALEQTSVEELTAQLADAIGVVKGKR